MKLTSPVLSCPSCGGGQNKLVIGICRKVQQVLSAFHHVVLFPARFVWMWHCIARYSGVKEEVVGPELCW